MRLLANGSSDRGLVRKVNEDSICVEEGLGLFAVADGMGGHAAGDIASAMAVDVLRYHIRKSGDVPSSNRLALGVRLANKVVYEAARDNEARHKMGTTVAAALSDGDRLSIAHVGDSRVYLVRSGSIMQLTEDHSLVTEQVKQGLMTKEEAEHSAVRNVITRALGQAPDVEVDLKDLYIADGDSILLCTDGLHTMVPDEVILSTVAPARHPESACEALIDAAKERGGEDNIAVVLIYVYKSKWILYLRKLLRWARR